MAALPAYRPTDADRPPPSTFPMTRAAKAALELDGRSELPRNSGEVVAVDGLTTLEQEGR